MVSKFWENTKTRHKINGINVKYLAIPLLGLPEHDATNDTP